MIDERKTKGQLITELGELRQRLIIAEQEQKKLKLSITELKRAENIMHARLRLLKFAESHSLEKFTQATLDESEALTASTIGFYHLVEADQRTLSLQTWSTNTLQHMCTAEGRGLHYDVAEAGVWADCIHQRQQVIHNSYDSLPYRKGMPPGHAPVMRELVVPIFRANKIVAIIGVGNKPSNYDAWDVEAVSMLGDLSWDITERKRAEEALAAERKQLFSVLETMPAYVGLLTPDYQVAFANRYFKERFGEPEGRRCYEYLFGRGDPCENCQAYKVLETKTPQEYEWLGPDGRTYQIYDQMIHDTDGSRLILEMGIDITERKRTEEALIQRYAELHEITQRLERSKNMLQLIIETIPVRVFWKDRELRYLGCNSLFACDAGLSKPEQLLGKDDFAMGWAEQAEAYQADDRQVMESCRSKMNIVEPQTTPTGANIWLNTSKVPLQIPNGEVLGVLGVYEDITARYQMEEALRESQNKLLSIFRAAPVGIGLVFNRSIQEANDTLCRMTGYSREQLVGQSARMLYPTEEEFNYVGAEKYQQITEFGTGTVETRWKCQDGKIIDLILSSTPLDAADLLKGVTFTALEITERKHAEEAVKESLRLRQQIIDTIPSPIFYKGIDGCYMGVNQAFLRFHGKTMEEVVGKTVHDVFLKEIADKYFQMDQDLFQNPGVQAYEFHSYDAQGQSREILLQKATFLNQEGRVAGLAGIMIDITEKKKADEERLRYCKIESLGTLAGGIAHDFNNILTAILGNIGLAALDSKIDPRVQSSLTLAEAACLRAQALSQQLLSFAKGGAPIKELFSMAELLTESAAFACTGSPVKAETSFPENLWWVEADLGQIGQVFQNLTINAIQAMPTGGTIKIWAENLTLGPQSGLPLSTGKYIKISVRDQGTGIPAEHLPRIFDPYFTTKQKGSGLGLTSAYTIIKNHQGHIDVESKPEVGTTFHIYLPAVDQQATPQSREGRALLVGTGKILVMDDEEMVREVLGRMLARLGYEADFARDGVEAIEMFVRAKRSDQAFVAVILDLTIPGAMGGKETMARLLEIDPQIKAIVSSGYSEDALMADCKKYGFSGVIAKPYRISELGEILNQVILKKA
jgi:PAS domain S-box-containing protein